MEPRVFELICGVQNYLWGKKGTNSKVAQLRSSSDSEFIVNEHSHYAELWMGTHTNCPSKLRKNDVLLSEHLSKFPEFIGERVSKKFKSLPFLFKILSVDIALSIQVHPDKNTAELLHSTDPEHYADPNHKPELAIALTDFKALVAFRPYADIVASFNDTPELREIISCEDMQVFEKLVMLDLQEGSEIYSETAAETMKTCFRSAITADVATVHRVLKLLFARFSDQTDSLNDEAVTFLQLYLQHPGDAGCLMVFFLNIVHLSPGQAIFLKAGLPHAYLSGDCIECMACSDNVVRAGLTPKFKDVERLCSIIDLRPPTTENTIFFAPSPPIDPNDHYLITFRPEQASEFAVDQIKLPANVLSYSLKHTGSGCICIVISGHCSILHASIENDDLNFKTGSVFFVSSDADIKINPVIDSSKKHEDVIIYRAYCPIDQVK